MNGRLMCVSPSAEFSTYDCWRGMRDAFRQSGADIAEYHLYRRIKMFSAAAQVIAPPGLEPDVSWVCDEASAPLVYRTIAEGCRWAFIVSGMGLHPNAVLALRRIGVKVACWFTESPYDTIEADRELYFAQLVDLAFTNERTAVDRFQEVVGRRGGRAYYLPHAYDPVRHRSIREDDPPLTERCDVLIHGTGFVERQVLLEAINWDGIDLAIGGLWSGISEGTRLKRHYRFPCTTNEDTIQLYRGAKIVLNPHRWAPGAESANPRVYEAAASGVFQICDHRAEITEMFGDAIPSYTPGVPWQLEALIRRYLADDDRRTSLAQDAQRRVQGQTFAARARFVLDAIEEFDRCRQPVAA